MKTKRPLKLLPVWLAVSAVIIIAGIILIALLGFNTSPEHKKRQVFEVRYDVSVQISPAKVEKLEDTCEAAFSDFDLVVSERSEGIESYRDLDQTVVTYVFSGTPSVKALDDAKGQIENEIKAAAELADAQISVDYYSLSMIEGLSDTAMWRGAVALTVGAVLGLIYIGFRFGVGSALTGLCAAAHDAVFTLAFFAIARIPTYAYAPLLYAAIAAIFSLVFWLLHCMKLRDVKKDPALRSMGCVIFSGLTAELAAALWLIPLLYPHSRPKA